jgi:hypothetical protein
VETTGAGSWGGEERNGLKRLGQPGPVKILVPAGTRVDKAAPPTTKAIAAIAMAMFFSSLIAWKHNREMARPPGIDSILNSGP